MAYLFRVGMVPFQKNCTLPKKHGKGPNADDGPEDTCRDGVSIDDVRHTVNSSALTKFLEHMVDIPSLPSSISVASYFLART